MQAQLKKADETMGRRVDHMCKEFSEIRAGRANPAVLDKVTVDYYGTPTPVNQVAAVSDLTDYPPEAVSLPKVGGFDGKTLSMEKIISYKPDLVYLAEGMHNFLIQELEANKIAYYVSKGSSIASVEGEIIDLGKITGHEKEAKILVTEMKQKLSSFRNSDDGEKVTVYYEVWNAPYMSVGSTSFINDVITCEGAKNIFADF